MKLIFPIVATIIVGSCTSHQDNIMKQQKELMEEIEVQRQISWEAERDIQHLLREYHDDPLPVQQHKTVDSLISLMSKADSVNYTLGSKYDSLEKELKNVRAGN